MNETQPTHIDLFAGVGGFSLAFESEGFTTVAYSETDQDKCLVYEHFFPGVPNLGDIKAITRNTVGRVDVITGGASLAHLRVLSDKCAVLLTNAGSGPKLSEWSACFDHATESLKTRQASLFSTEDGSGMESCQDFARSDMIVGGMYFPLPRLVQDISESASCSSLPTPISNDALKRGAAYWNENRKGTTFGDNLPRAVAKLLPTPVSADGKRGPDYARANRPGSGSDDLVTTLAKLLPTPTARDYKDTPGMATTAKDGRQRDDQLPRRIYADVSAISETTSIGGMRLTPEFLSWLMGFPPNWLKPLRDVPAMRLCRKPSNPSPEH